MLVMNEGTTSSSSRMPEPCIIAPEEEQPANYQAFKEDELYLQLFPHGVLHHLKDDESVENRKIALTSIHQAILNCNDPELLNKSLKKIVILVKMPLNDTNIKIVLAGLQVIQDLVNKVGKHITPYLDQIIATYLEKIGGTNKYNIKQAGMKLVTCIMSVAGPKHVMDIITELGLASKKSKIREETINVVIVTLLTFPDSDLDLSGIVQKIVPLLADGRQNVRQACLEACVVLSMRLGKDNLQKLVSAVASIDQLVSRDGPGPTNLMEAFQYRLSRNVPPSLNSDGLVSHGINVANGKNSGCHDGPDVSWILAASGKSTNSPGGNGRKVSMSGAGPLRSAGKKLPWDPTEKLMKLPSQYSHPPAVVTTQQHLSYSLIYNQQSTSNSHHGSSPKHKSGYLELYNNRSTVRASIPTDFKQHGGTDTSHLFSDNDNSSYGVSTSTATDVFSTTWPRSNGYYSSFMKTTGRVLPDTATNTSTPSNQHTNSSKPTLPSLGRPPSKPLVRNLFPLPQTTSSSSTRHSQPPLLVPSANTVSSTLTNPTQLEKNFLTGHVDDDDQEYFSIPVDDSLLNSSLSSSVSSLCNARDLQSATNNSNTKKSMANQKADMLNQFNLKFPKSDMTTNPSSTIPCGKMPMLHQGQSPMKQQHKQRNNKTNQSLSIQKTKSPPQKTNTYVDGRGMSYTSERGHLTDEETHVETVLNKTFTISPRSLPQSQPKTMIQHKTAKPTSYTEVAIKKKLITSPPRESAIKPNSYLHGVSTPSANNTQTNAHVQPQAIVINTIDTNNPGYQVRKIKKSSPQKSVPGTIATSLKPNESLSPTNAACNSAPVYRIAPDSTCFESNDCDNSLVDLEPLPNPEVAMKQACEDLTGNSEEWEKKCSGLLIIRRLAAFNKELLLPQLTHIISIVNREVRNLRSQVARGAIACFGDMFAFLGREMEQSLDSIVQTLLQVGSKSNTFFREDVEKAINEMIKSINPNKCITSLISTGLHQSSNTVRRLLSQSLCSLVLFHDNDDVQYYLLKKLSKETIEKFLSALVTLFSDADVGARYHAKRSISALCSYADFRQIASKCLPKLELGKLKEASDIIDKKGVGKPPLEIISAKMTRQSINGSYGNRSVTAPLSGPTPLNRQDNTPKPRKRRISAVLAETPSVEVITVPLPDGLLIKMASNDWNERNQAITELEKFVLAHPNALGANIVKIFDVFNLRLTDQNSKVNLHALESFQQFIPHIGVHLSPVLSTIVENLAKPVASRYPTIHSAAINAMDTLIGSVDHTQLLPLLSSAALNGNTRIQPFMLRKLADIIPNLKLHHVQRVILPLLWKVLASRGPQAVAAGETKAALKILCQSLVGSLGSEKLESSMMLQTPDLQQRLKEILHKV